MSEKISVIVGTYNQKRLLPKVIKGWEKQTFKDFKLYICDDGSDDGTEKWVKSLETSVKFEYFCQENKGMRLAKNINNGLKKATGEYALFAMGDSVPAPEYLERFIPYLDKNWVLCGARENVTEDMEHIDWDWRYRSRPHQLGWNFVPIQANQWGRITGNGLLVPLDALAKIGYWPEEFEGYGCDDNYIALKLFAEGLEFADVPRAVLRHIEHPAQPDNEENVRAFTKEVEKTLEELRERLRPQTVCLNFDDFSPVNNNLYFLRKLRENYPRLKISLFLIPESIQTGKPEGFLDHPDLCDELRNELDWLEFCPHGWSHPDQSAGYKPEFEEMSYYETDRYIKLIDKFFKQINLPYQKIFKAPQYQISTAAKDCFRDNGWTLAIDGTGEFWPKDIKTVAWNWNVVNDFPLRKTVISYSHIQSIGNGLEECWAKILQMPTDAEFKFLSEIVR